MLQILPLLFAAVLLAACIGAAYWIWIRPLGRLNVQKTGALFLTLLAMSGGLIGGFFWWSDQRQSFAWDLPPLASRMLAAAGWSFFVLCLLAVRKPTARRLRLVMLSLFVYLVPLAGAILLFHLDRFDPQAPITYSFFAIVAGMSVASTWYLLRPVRVVIDQPVETIAPGPATRAWMVFLAFITALWGLALFFTDAGPSALIWVWQGDLLSSRLIAVMLLTIAAGSLYSLRDAGTARLMMAMTITYSLGIVAATLWSLTAGMPVKVAYTAVFGIVFLVSAAVLLTDRFRLPRSKDAVVV